MRFAAGVEYDGQGFAGWQMQAGVPTVAGHLIGALSTIADRPVSLICAGRTDAGVHASGQVIHFDAPVQRSSRAWLFGTNANLPRQISLSWVRPVPQHFHARFSALARTYRYEIRNRPARSALYAGRALWQREALDTGAMNAAAAQLCGEHDFSSFRAADCTSRSAVRRITRLRIERSGERIWIEVTANAFLLHMVRNLVGALLATGRGGLAPAEFPRLLQARDRRLAPPMAAAEGLYLAQVDYDPAFGIPAAADPL